MTKLRKAQLDCANWNIGNCLGCSISIDRGYLKRNKWAPVFMTIKSKKAEKPCIVEDGCKYFDNFVAR
jgi:hypothetical protein